MRHSATAPVQAPTTDTPPAQSNPLLARVHGRAAMILELLGSATLALDMEHHDTARIFVKDAHRVALELRGIQEIRRPATFEPEPVVESSRLARLLRTPSLPVRIVGALLAAVMLVGLALAFAPKAGAAVLPRPAVSAPPAVVATSPIVHATVYVRSTGEPSPHGYWTATARVYTARWGWVEAGGGVSDTGPLVRVPVAIDTRATGFGNIEILGCDDNPAAECGMATVRVLRQTSVVIASAQQAGPQQASVVVRVMHRDPSRGLIASKRSPVKVEQWTALRGWVIQATPVTDSNGWACAVVSAGEGLRLFRAVRPQGSTVTGATSRTVGVIISSEAMDNA